MSTEHLLQMQAKLRFENESYIPETLEQMRCVFNSSGYIKYAEDFKGNRITIRTGTGGRIESLSDPAGAFVTFYFLNDKLTKIVDNLSNRTDSYTYYYDGNQRTKLDLSGVSSYTYDGLGRLSEARLADGTVQQYTFDGNGNRKTMTAGSMLYRYADKIPRTVKGCVDLDATIGRGGKNNASTLDWSNTNQRGETALEHINRHATPNYQRANHGVFNGNPQTVVERAWATKGAMIPISDGMGGSIYNIPYLNAGYQSGYQYFGQQMNYITIITQEGTNTLWTAFPSFGNYGNALSILH